MFLAGVLPTLQMLLDQGQRLGGALSDQHRVCDAGKRC